MVGYNQIFPQVQPVDIGNTLRTAAALKGAETQNRLLSVREAELNRTVADRNALRAALPGALNGDADASAEVAAINPELWMKLDANKKAKIKQDLETTGRLLYSVEQSADKPAAYQAARAQAQTLGLDISKVPEQYDPNWVRSNIAAATSLSDQIKLAEGQKPQVVAPGGALVGRDGKVIFSNPDRTQPLVEVADPKNPGKTIMVSREQAQGMPGAKSVESGGTFKGTGMDAQAWNVLLDPKADPASPAYAAAWSHLNTPKQQVVTDPSTGQPSLVTIQPQMPPNIAPPTSGAPVRAPGPAAAPPATVAPDAIPAVPVASAAPPAGALGTAAAAEPAASMPTVASPAAAQAAAPQQIAPGVTSVPVGGPKKIPDVQAVAAGYANRMTSAEKIVGDIEAKGYNPAGANAVLSRAPGVGNFIASAETQQYRQAASDWIRAKLRKESGAAIGEKEMEDEFKTYFPQPGDGPAVIAQKKQRRMVATQNLVAESQGGYEKLFGGKGAASAKADPLGIR